MLYENFWKLNRALVKQTFATTIWCYDNSNDDSHVTPRPRVVQGRQGTSTDRSSSQCWPDCETTGPGVGSAEPAEDFLRLSLVANELGHRARTALSW